MELPELEESLIIEYRYFPWPEIRPNSPGISFFQYGIGRIRNIKNQNTSFICNEKIVTDLIEIFFISQY